MLRNLYLVPVLALFLLPAMAHAQFEAGNWDLQLSGSGTASSGGSLDTGDFNVQLQLGYLMTKEFEVGVRQDVIWSDGGSLNGGTTLAFLDYHFDLDRWQPYVGANIGYQYGSLRVDSWLAGPEAGVKYFVNSTTYVQLGVAYEWDVDNGPQEGLYAFNLGVGFKW